MPQEFWANAVYSVIPTLVFGFFFYVVIRAIVRGDRREREVKAKIEAEVRAEYEAERSARRAPASTE